MVDEDRLLIMRLKQGDCRSFEVLFDKYRRPVFAYAKGILKDRALAEDCVQDVFLELVRKVDKIDAERGVKGWLFRVARNKAIDVIRSRQKEIAGENCADAADDSGSEPDVQMILNERSVQLISAIEGLKDEEKEIIMLRFFGGLTFAEAETATDTPLNTLIWRCHRALRKLEGIIGRD